MAVKEIFKHAITKSCNLCLCLLCFLFFSVFTSCISTGLSGDAGDVISANAQSVGRLEGTVDSLDRILESSRDRLSLITRASERITNGVDKLEYLFDEYEQEVNRLLNEVDSLRTEIKNAEKGSVDTASSSNSSNNN